MSGIWAQAGSHFALPTPVAERQMEKLWREPKRRVLEKDEDFSWMQPSTPTIPDGACAKLSGFVSKMHRTRRLGASRWASRFIDVDDYRGRVQVQRGRHTPPRTVCSLADVSLAVAEPPLAHAFVIKSGGVHVTVSARNEMELTHWLTNLQARIDAWKNKAERPPEARPAFGAAGEETFWVKRATDGTWRATW